MKSTLKNILIFTVIGVALFAVYFFVIKKDEPEENLVSSSNSPIANAPINTAANNETFLDSEFAKQILATLSNVKSITLNDAVFSSIAFQSLVDGSIPLIPDNNEGRPNPFAPIGQDSGSISVPVTNPNPSATPAEDLGFRDPFQDENSDTPVPKVPASSVTNPNSN